MAFDVAVCAAHPGAVEPPLHIAELAVGSTSNRGPYPSFGTEEPRLGWELLGKGDPCQPQAVLAGQLM